MSCRSHDDNVRTTSFINPFFTTRKWYLFVLVQVKNQPKIYKLKDIHEIYMLHLNHNNFQNTEKQDENKERSWQNVMNEASLINTDVHLTPSQFGGLFKQSNSLTSLPTCQRTVCLNCNGPTPPLPLPSIQLQATEVSVFSHRFS